MNRQFSIAEWTIKPELNAISKDDETIHLEPRVMQVLLELANHPGEVLSKEHLIEAVWSGIFVSDDALTRCISLLRREMRDDLHTPRYIQTIPKVGYRLVAAVRHPELDTKHAVESVVAALPENAGSTNVQANSFNPAKTRGINRKEYVPPVDSSDLLLADEGVNPSIKEGSKVEIQAEAKLASFPATGTMVNQRRWQILAISALIFGILIGLAVLKVTHLLSRRGNTAALRVVSLTSYAGLQDQARFSPDGTRVVFVWTSPDDGSRNLFIKQIGSETLLRLTHGPEADYAPAWSPDGTQIAYLAATGDGSELGIYLLSSMGGPARKLYAPKRRIHWEQGGLSWSPDSSRLIFADRDPEHTPASAIYSLALDTLSPTQLTTPPPTWDGDLSPAYSPDGRKIAFIRAVEGAVRNIDVIPASGGNPKQITNDNQIVNSLAWSPDNGSIIFSSDRGGEFALWRVALRGGAMERLPVGTANAFQPDISGAMHRLLYSENSAIWSILGFRLHSRDTKDKQITAEKPITVVSSTEQDSAPSWAPDGVHFAFQSWRSGSQELWIASRDGLSLMQLTSGGHKLTGSPTFSPDGRSVAFDCRPDLHSHIFIVPSTGGESKALTSGNSNDILPRWSADGKWIYFASNRSGNWQSWKVAAQGGEPEQVTKQGGYLAMESPDGKWVYFTRGDQSGLWRVPVAGGQEVQVLPQPLSGYWGYWAVTGAGIYYLDSNESVPRLMIFDPGTKKSTVLASLDRHPPPYSGISVSRSGDMLLMTDERNAGSHVTLVENFF